MRYLKFGSLKNRVSLQHDYDQYVMIADLQALTDYFDRPAHVANSVKIIWQLVKNYLSSFFGECKYFSLRFIET